uniref:Alpha-endosulfine n=1 Tax=Schistocephalus solidus TaxID=70667 RepID=A0A0X3Q032_SCHSO
MSASEVRPKVTTEEEQELKFKSKYPGLAQKGAGSLLLQKRLNRGHKFFDSGDYNVARAKILQHKATPAQAQADEEMLHESTGEVIATPESVPAVRKKSMAGEAVVELGGPSHPLVLSPRASQVLSSATTRMDKNPSLSLS